MDKFNEDKFLKLEVAKREADNDFHQFVREALTEGTKAVGGKITFPESYKNDFSHHYIEGKEVDILGFSLNGCLFIETSRGPYSWMAAENNMAIVDAVMNYYYLRPPMFPQEN